MRQVGLREHEIVVEEAYVTDFEIAAVKADH